MEDDRSAVDSVSLEGTLERILFSREDDGWTVLRLLSPSGLRTTAVGSVFGIEPGDRVRLTGRWVEHPKYGRQLAIESFLPLTPTTVGGIERYLASGMVRGIGPVMAKRLVQHFGMATLEVIESLPERLAEVPGVGPKRAASIQQAWGRQREIRNIMVFLAGHGVGTAHAARIFKRYGSEAVRLVSENPYRLAVDVHGIGFATADAIARRVGIPDDSPHRAAASILHTLGEAAGEGHLFLPNVELIERCTALLSQPEPVVASGLARLLGAGRVVVERASRGSLPTEPLVYLPHLHDAERTIATRLACIARGAKRQRLGDVDAFLRAFEGTSGLVLAEAQRQAVRAVADGRVTIVTGGPGTGKTTLIRALVELFGHRAGARLALAAPTGRAAKRLAEATGEPARTLHRLLEWSPQEGGFTRDGKRPLGADLVIVDEASMLDAPLAASLLAAISDQARLVLVGDVDQLPSVGPGAVLSDCIASGEISVVRLETIFRQVARSAIVQNAHRIRRGEMPELAVGRRADASDFYFIAREEPEAALATVEELVVERIPRSFGLDPASDVQVLSPMHRGVLGVGNLNRRLQELLNPTGEALARGLRIGDKVLQTRNNYELDVFNGDVGRLVAVRSGDDDDETAILVQYDDREVAYSRDQLDELVLAYATSIHKSQGSEYPAVVVPLHTQHYLLLRRNLLYTAVTRGRQLVVLVGSRRAVGLAVRQQQDQLRHSRLAERLREEGSGR